MRLFHILGVDRWLGGSGCPWKGKCQKTGPKIICRGQESAALGRCVGAFPSAESGGTCPLCLCHSRADGQPAAGSNASICDLFIQSSLIRPCSWNTGLFCSACNALCNLLRTRQRLWFRWNVADNSWTSEKPWFYICRYFRWTLWCQWEIQRFPL